MTSWAGAPPHDESALSEQEWGAAAETGLETPLLPQQESAAHLETAVSEDERLEAWAEGEASAAGAAMPLLAVQEQSEDEYGQPLLGRQEQEEHQVAPAQSDVGQVLQRLRRELGLRFSDPADPRLHERRRRLRELFAAVPADRTRELHRRLGLRPTSDELSKLFHGRLAQATRSELLQVLEARFPPASTADPQRPAAPPVWPSSPLPPGSETRLAAAVSALRAAIDRSSDRRAWRYRCWLDKLAAGADDRVIEWHRICPRTTGALGAAYLVGPCDITAGSAIDQTLLQAAIRTAADVDGADQRLTLFTRMRSEIVFDHEVIDPAFLLENFSRFHDEVGRTVDKLALWANNPMGGSSAMPPAYRALKDWVGARQRDPRSVYSCL